jgi:hypothetical protein
VETNPIRPQSEERWNWGYAMLDSQLIKQRHEDMLREAELNRQAKALRAARKKRDGWSPALAWELKRGAERLLKLLKVLKNAD